jgi:VanZ family protein
MKSIGKIVLYLIFFTCLLFLFVDGPTAESARSYLRGWDLGHILLFFIAGILFLTDFRKYFRDNFYYHLLIIMIFSLVLGILTELIQVRFHRSPDLGDLVRDLLGAALAIAFFSPRRHENSKVVVQAIQSFLILLALVEIYPLSRVLFDERIVKKHFPVISDFETPFEKDRWQHEKPLKVETEIVRNGSHAMRVQLTSAKYSTVSIRYFYPDWRGYNIFHFSIFNSGTDTLMMVCRINDRRHYNLGQQYNDRFNRRVNAVPGWNDYSFSITEIVKAPVSRRMDIKNIDLICFFSMELANPRDIYIDHLYLSN